MFFDNASLEELHTHESLWVSGPHDHISKMPKGPECLETPKGGNPFQAEFY